MLLLCFNPLNSHELCIKITYCSGHIQEVCICSSRLSGTNWAHESPRVDPSHIPPHPPICLQPPVRDDKRTEVRGGGAAAGHLLPSVLRPHSLTALTLHICQLSPVISDGPPFYRENAPVGALKSEMSPPLGQRSFGWGGGVTKERNEAWRGGGREKRVWLENTSSPGKKFTGPLHLIPPILLFGIAALFNTLVIRSSLKD